MHYRGPQPADFANVRALNSAYVDLLCRALPASRPQLEELPPELQSACRKLTHAARARLAAAPFLLFSLQESDAEFWQRLLAQEATPDLLRDVITDPAETAIVTAGLGFAWQLAHRDAYTARLLCGASLHWCEQIAEVPLVDLVRAAALADVLSLRAADDTGLWRVLLIRATCRERALSDAARVSALQRVLTATRPAGSGAGRLAARRVNTPLQVADRRSR